MARWPVDMYRVIWNRASLQHRIVAVLVLVALVFLPATLILERLLPRGSSIVSRPGRVSRGLAGDSWHWGKNQDEWEEPEADGGNMALLHENRQRYQAEVDELKVIAQSLRDEIRSMHVEIAARKAEDSPADGRGGRSRSHRHHRDHLGLREAGAMAEQVPKEGDDEYDLRCPQPVDDILMPLSPVKMSPLPDIPKIMPKQGSLEIYPLPSTEQSQSCTVATCLDIARCSLSRPFRVFVYDETLPGLKSSRASSVRSLHEHVVTGVRSSGYLTHQESEACMYVVVIQSSALPASSVSAFLQRLSFWRGDGRNHIVIDIPGDSPTDKQPAAMLSKVSYSCSNAILASLYSGYGQLRSNFDLFFTMPLGSIVKEKETDSDFRYALLPAFRPSLLQFSSFELSVKGKSGLAGQLVSKDDLVRLQKRAGEEFVFQLDCRESDRQLSVQSGVTGPSSESGWYWCGSRYAQAKRSLSSTFTLVIEPLVHSVVQAQQFFDTLEYCLQYGSVPVVLRTFSYALPFQEVISWEKAAIILPAARVTELNYVLANVFEDDILSMKHQGRFLWETYFSSASVIIASLVNVVRHRLGLPANPLLTVSLSSHLSKPGSTSFKELPSPQYQQNFTYGTLERWNSAPG